MSKSLYKCDLWYVRNDISNILFVYYSHSYCLWMYCSQLYCWNKQVLLLVPTRNASLQSLCRELFCRAYSEQTQLFLLPALAHAGPDAFPAVLLLPALVPVGYGGASVGDEGDTEGWELTVEPSPSLLWAVLVLLEKHLCKCLVCPTIIIIFYLPIAEIIIHV